MSPFEQALQGFQRRVDDLRAGRGASAGPAWQEAALLELEVASEELRVQHEEALRVADQVVTGSDRDRSVREAFVQAPVPMLILDGGDGVIRRFNRAALELLGISGSYASGRPFPVFVDLRFRGSLRSSLAAVARDGTERTVRVRLVRRAAAPLESLIVLTRLDLAEGEPQVLACVPGPGHEARQIDTGPSQEPVEIGELRANLTRALLSPEQPLRAAGQALLDLADWVLIDLAEPEGSWHREVLSRCEAPEETKSLLEPGELTWQVHEAGRGRVVAHLDDLRMLAGGDAVPMASGSVVCVPITAKGRAYGTLTTIRSAVPYTLHELALLEETGAQVALRMLLDRS